MPLRCSLQMLFFKVETQYAFTIVVAARAFTLMVLPNACAVPAFLAGLTRVLSMHKPGMVNLPVFLTSMVARAAKSSITFAHCDFLRPLFVAKVSAMAVFVK